jgi:putative RNA 2'-phosphotransferase
LHKGSNANRNPFLIKLSRTLSHALRHEPWRYGLVLDNHGWVRVTDLLICFRNRRNDWRHLTENDIIEMISKSAKNRFELYEGKIRALYGHSLREKVLKVPAEPPAVLFHGTSSRLMKQIKNEGLKPMRRQYVHLSVDEQTALQVAKRKEGTSVIITISAIKAYLDGIKFYQGNGTTWLTDYIPSEYIDSNTTTTL